MLKLLIFTLIASIGSYSHAESDFTKYQIDDQTWSFKLITETCPKLLTQAIEELSLQEGLTYTYPETMSDTYFNVTITDTEKKITGVMQFKYWTNYDRTLCENVSAEQWLD